MRSPDTQGQAPAPGGGGARTLLSGIRRRDGKHGLFPVFSGDPSCAEAQGEKGQAVHRPVFH